MFIIPPILPRVHASNARDLLSPRPLRLLLHELHVEHHAEDGGVLIQLPPGDATLARHRPQR